MVRRCEHCGYELPATPETPRCPECGVAPPTDETAVFPLAKSRSDDKAAPSRRRRARAWMWRWFGWALAVVFTPRRYGRRHDLRRLPWDSRRRLLAWGLAAPFVGAFAVRVVDGAVANLLSPAPAGAPAIPSGWIESLLVLPSRALLAVWQNFIWTAPSVLMQGLAACVFAAAMLAASRLRARSERAPALVVWCHAVPLGVLLGCIGNSQTLWVVRSWIVTTGLAPYEAADPSLVKPAQITQWLDAEYALQAATDCAILFPWFALAAVWVFGRGAMSRWGLVVCAALVIAAGLLIVDWLGWVGVVGDVRNIVTYHWGIWTYRLM